MSEFKLISLNRQSSSQNIYNLLLEIYKARYTQYLLSNEAYHKIYRRSTIELEDKVESKSRKTQ
jgi:hypothetical protein